jgi:adenylate kinase
MKNILLFGSPGVGKGTYGKLLSNHYGYPVFSMGDYFRKVINDSTKVNDPFVTSLRDTLRKGLFVDDITAINVIKHARETNKSTLFIDGMPRTIN